MSVAHIKLINEGVTYECNPTVEDVVKAIMEEYKKCDASIGEILRSTHVDGLNVHDVVTVYARCYGLAENDDTTRRADGEIIQLSEQYSARPQQFGGDSGVDADFNEGLTDTEGEYKTFIVVATGDHVRDAQIDSDGDSAENEDARWYDMSGHALILDTITAKDDQGAMTLVAETRDVSMSILEAYEIK